MQASLEGDPDDWPAGDGEDDAGEGGGLRVQDHLLQRQLLHAHLEVPRRVGEDGQDTLRDCEVSVKSQQGGSVPVSRYYFLLDANAEG